MSPIDKLYRRDNYIIEKSVSIDDGLYTRLKELIYKEFDAKISQVINVCVEELILEKDLTYYPKPEGEIGIYRNVMLRKNNLEALNMISYETGISLTRLINMAIKQFIEKYGK